MLINSVILVLQETLEAALLISVLLSISFQRRVGASWLPYGLVSGGVFAGLYAANMAVISVWFDYVGQEIINALLQTGIALLIPVYGWLIFAPVNAGSSHRQNNITTPQQVPVAAAWSAVAIVTMAIAREGSEVYLYISGFFLGSDHLSSVLAGSGLGFGIGLSIGTLLFFALSSDHNRWRRRVAILLLALFAGNMLSQSVLQLIQADWISGSAACWDTSSWISEQSVTGQLLYASFGYEATPSVEQIMAHLIGTLVVFSLIAGRSSFAQNQTP